MVKNRIFSLLSLLVITLALTVNGETETPVELKCRFRDQIQYSCFAEVANIEENAIFSGLSGKHAKNKSNSDVRAFIAKDKNELTIIPKNISSLFPQLTHFEVKNSPVTKLSEEVFQGLENLEFLKLVKNSIAELPQKVFSDLKNLKVLIINGNQLEAFAYRTFESNEKLEILNLENNKIKFVHEKLLKPLGNLREIYLQNNFIEELREQTFAGNENLEQIDVKNNQLKAIGPEILKNLKNLKFFDFSENDCIKKHSQNVTEVVEQLENFCAPPDLKRFEEEIKELKENEKNFKEKLENCEKLKEEEMKTAGEEKEGFESTISNLESEKSSLESDLETCKSEKDSCDEKLEKIEEINKLSTEKLNKTDEKLLECTSRVENSTENLSIINDSLKLAKTSLQRCVLETETLKNALQLNEALSEASTPYRTLKEKFDALELENFRLKTDNDLLTKKFNEFKGITHEISDEKCSEKLKKCLNKLPVCSSFFLNCEFSAQDFIKNEGLNEYICTSRHISTCSEGMKLQSVEGTHFEQRSNYDVNVLIIEDSFFIINNEIFTHLPNLRKLQLKNAGLDSLQPNLKSHQLRTLDIENNKIRDIHANAFSGVNNLESLLLEKNQIEELNEKSFSGLENLLELSLNDNNIAELPKGVFNDLQTLTHLSLKSNKLRVLDGKLLEFNGRLEVLQLNENPSLKFIGSELLDFSTMFRIVQFDGTCVGNVTALEDVKKRISNNCKYLMSN